MFLFLIFIMTSLRMFFIFRSHLISLQTITFISLIPSLSHTHTHTHEHTHIQGALKDHHVSIIRTVFSEREKGGEGGGDVSNPLLLRIFLHLTCSFASLTPKEVSLSLPLSLPPSLSISLPIAESILLIVFSFSLCLPLSISPSPRWTRCYRIPRGISFSLSRGRMFGVMTSARLLWYHVYH